MPLRTSQRLHAAQLHFDQDVRQPVFAQQRQNQAGARS